MIRGRVSTRSMGQGRPVWTRSQYWTTYTQPGRVPRMNTQDEDRTCPTPGCGNKREIRGHHTRGKTYRPTCRRCRYLKAKEMDRVEYGAQEAAIRKKRSEALILELAQCERCGFKPEILSQLHMHHVNGDRSDNRDANLEFVCLNCHALIHAASLGRVPSS